MKSISLKSLIKPALRVTLGVVVGYPVFLSLTFYLLQERILFLPAPISYERLNWLNENIEDIEEIRIKTPDGVRLHGWLVKDTRREWSSLLIYFGGNAEEVSGTVANMPRFHGWSLLAVNYRGFGFSEGRPSEETLFKDALFIYDYIEERADIDPPVVVAMGRSLGTGVAVHLARERSLNGVILVSPYDSVTDVAQELYRFIPVSLLLRHPFDSIKLAPSIDVPMLALVATEDELVRPWRSRRLVEAWGGEYNLQLIEGKGHVGIHSHEVYWKSIEEFLEGL